MATALDLNKKSIQSLKKFAALDADGVQQLSDLLADNLEQLTERSDAVALSKKATALSSGDAFELIDFFAPLCMWRLSEVTDYRELVQGILDSLSRLSEGTTFSKVELRTLKSKLSTIFSRPNLALKSKAIRLQMTHERIFQKAEFLTDIRPVFSANGKVAVEAAVTFQTLRVEYYEGTETKVFSCALDSQDLKKLRDALERAEKKQSSLIDVLNRAGLPLLKVE